MKSTDVLVELPSVFVTGDYEAAAGVRPSSASRALGEFAAEGFVSKIRRGTWRNLTVPQPTADQWLVDPAVAVSHHWSPEWEAELEAVYGGVPRRVSGLTAFAMAGMPIVCRREVTVAAKAAVDTDALGFVSRRERPAAVLTGATRLTEHTWVSTPARAVLECAQHPHRYHRYEEHFGRMIANRFDLCATSDVAELARALGWNAALRRLSSIAEGLTGTAAGRELGFDIDPRWAGLNRAARRWDHWIHLTPVRRADDIARRMTRDDARKVHWGTTPDGLAHQIST